MFPRAGFSNFISPELVANAQRRRIPLVDYQNQSKILSVDPARFGDDASVITLRQGLKVHYQIELQGFDGPDLAGRVFELCRSEGVVKGFQVPPGPISLIAYDAIGNGADLDSALRRMPGLRTPLMPVQWGVPASDPRMYFNQRAEAWGTMRDWLEHGQIPEGDDLMLQLTSLDYGSDDNGRIQLQSKRDCKKNGGKSPDRGDSLAIGFVPQLITTRAVSAKVRPVKRRTVIWSK